MPDPGAPDFTIQVDDPRAPEVRALLEAHLAFAREHSPPEDVHALDLEGLLASQVTFVSLRRETTLLGVAALNELDPQHAEIKSMHTAAASRGQGVGRALVTHLLDLAASRGFTRVSLETGTMAAFAPARALYVAAGFRECPPFADYTDSANSVCMTRRVGTGIG